MSYSQRGNKLKSWTTGREYAFSRTPDGAGLRQARALLEKEDAEYRAAAANGGHDK